MKTELNPISSFLFIAWGSSNQTWTQHMCNQGKQTVTTLHKHPMWICIFLFYSFHQPASLFKFSIKFWKLAPKWRRTEKGEWHTEMVQTTKSFFSSADRQQRDAEVTAERGLEKRCLVYESRWPGLPAGWLLSLRSTVPEQRQTHTHTHTHSYILNACRVHWNAAKHASTHQQLNQLPLWQRCHSHRDESVGSLSARWWRWAKG